MMGRADTLCRLGRCQRTPAETASLRGRVAGGWLANGSAARQADTCVSGHSGATERIGACCFVDGWTVL